MTLSGSPEFKVSKENVHICFNVINESSSQISLLQSLSRNIEWTVECNVQIDHIGKFSVRWQYLNFPSFTCFTCKLYTIWNSESHKYSAANTYLRHLKNHTFTFDKQIFSQVTLYIKWIFASEYGKTNKKFYVSYFDFSKFWTQSIQKQANLI